MKIRTDFVTNSSSSSFLVITIAKKDGNNIVLESEDRGFAAEGSFKCSSARDLYNALVEGFEEDTEGVEDFLDEVLKVKDINDLVSMKIENSTTSWEGDVEDPDDWEDGYDEVNYDEESGCITGTDTAIFTFQNGRAVRVK